jgi:maltooligosyltrehalose trehalohydrolase
LLFMGQEFLASTRFTFFADHKSDLSALVHRGRREFLAQFAAYATREVQNAIRNPGAEETFLDSRLDWSEATAHSAALRLHRDLLQLRRDDPVISNQDEQALDGATLTDQAFVLRWFTADAEDRLLLVNFGRESVLDPAPEPLLAPPLRHSWHVQWASEDPRYGGQGIIAPVSSEGRWRIPSECAVLLQAKQ